MIVKQAIYSPSVCIALIFSVGCAGRYVAATSTKPSHEAQTMSEDRLAIALDKSDPDLVGAAIHSLPTLGTTNAIRLLRAILKHRDAQVRYSGIMALGLRKDRTVLHLLVEAYGAEEAPTRELVVTTVGLIGGKSTLPFLTTAITDRDACVRDAVVFAIRSLNVAEVLPLYAKTLVDVDEGVQLSTIHVLSDCEDDAVVPLLQLALTNGSESVRAAAAKALERDRGDTTQ